MQTHPFAQVDVFSEVPCGGNPVAIVSGADDLPTDTMQRLANWTNLSETAFLLEPTDPGADYRVRIFTPGAELPFAGHPTIGSCHAWLEFGGTPRTSERIVQECGVGLVGLRRSGGRLAFAAPPLLRSGAVDSELLDRVCRVLRIERSDVVAAQWADNGPGWIAVLLRDAAAVLSLEPDFTAGDGYDVGVVGPHPIGVVGPVGDAEGEAAIEVRAFFRAGDVVAEDPVTGSLNAALAQWLLDDGFLTSPYVAAQGTALGRSGRVFVEEAEGEIWVGGSAVTRIDGTVAL